ncbi:MAG: hypothetical protein IJU35_06835 [Paludibacteraceae bacterium]|nr:hypothetical protein [Paludibacteraceae bacterium]
MKRFRIISICLLFTALAVTAQIVDDVYFTPSQARQQSRRQRRYTYNTEDFRKGAKRIVFSSDTIVTSINDSIK